MFFKGHNARLLSKHFWLQPFFLKDSVSLLFANRGMWYIVHLEQIFSFRCVLFTCLNSFWCAIVCDCQKLFTLFLFFTLHVHWTWFKIVLYHLNVIQGHVSQNNITKWHKMFFKGHNARLLSKNFCLQPFFLKYSVSLLFA